MSFRTLLISITLPALFAALVHAQDAVPQPEVANSKYQIQGVINVDSVYIRSGPGEGYYPTETLAKGATITVVGIKFDWLKVLPPAGSYSYVGAIFVDKSADGSTGRINRNEVNIRAGSLVNAMKTTVQTRLNTGDEVQIIGKEDEYLKIKPPQGAYLYINKQFVTIARPAVAATPQAASAPQANSHGTQAIATANQRAAAAIVTSTPTTAPSPLVAAAPTTHPSVAAVPSTQPAQAAAPPPTPDELFAQYEDTFAQISKKPLDSQPIDDLIAKYQSLGNTSLSDDLKRVVDIRIATLKGRQDNKTKLVEIQKLQKQAADRQLALQAEQQELAERLKANQIQVFVAVGQLQPSSLQLGGGTLYRLVDPATGRTEIYLRTSDPKITALMGQFIGVNGQTSDDPQLSLRVIDPTDAAQVDQARVNSSVMASIIPPSMLARQASAN